MIKRDDLADLRKDYSKKNLSLASCDQNPLLQFNLWLDEAIAAQALEPTAMCLATADEKNKPSARMVLLKSVEDKGFVFFSNYDSRKGHQLSQNMQAALTFFWPELERQVRVEGSVQKLSTEASDTYFSSRPYQSRIGAWASLQSQPLSSDAVLIKRAAQFSAQYLQNVPRPPHWGGYIVKPDLIEFWQGRPSRLHDRVEYQLNNGQWILRKLYP